MYLEIKIFLSIFKAEDFLNVSMSRLQKLISSLKFSMYIASEHFQAPRRKFPKFLLKCLSNSMSKIF